MLLTLLFIFRLNHIGKGFEYMFYSNIFVLVSIVIITIILAIKYILNKLEKAT